ncbi:MAG: hypothetical protein IJX19_10820, partial [Clostridia bacterium]|nr:hypothetical protein [Clostridia bacterium]
AIPHTRFSENHIKPPPTAGNPVSGAEVVIYHYFLFQEEKLIIWDCYVINRNIKTIAIHTSLYREESDFRIIRYGNCNLTVFVRS